MSNYFLKDFKAALRGCLERVLLGLWQVWSTKIMSVMIMLDRVYLLIVTLLNYFLVNHECLCLSWSIWLDQEAEASRTESTVCKVNKL